jgi:hypothetical protein
VYEALRYESMRHDLLKKQATTCIRVPKLRLGVLELAQRQYLYCCTSKANKLSTWSRAATLTGDVVPWGKKEKKLL